jgi:hypothetical protein
MMNDELADAALPDLTGPDGQDSGTDLLARLLLLHVHKWMLPRRNSGSNYTKAQNSLFGQAPNRSSADRLCSGAMRHRF